MNVKYFLLLLTTVIFALPSAYATSIDYDPSWYQDDNSAQEDIPAWVNLQKIITMTTNSNSNKNYLNIMFNYLGIVSGMYNMPDPNNKADEIGGRNIFWLRDIESPEGAVLAVSRGRKALIMSGLLDLETQEGKFTLKYLSNGLMMRYKTCDFLLKRDLSGWYVQSAYSSEKITDIKVEIWAMGITTIHGICPKGI